LIKLWLIDNRIIFNQSEIVLLLFHHYYHGPATQAQLLGFHLVTLSRASECS